jgi:hypothetical protein
LKHEALDDATKHSSASLTDKYCQLTEAALLTKLTMYFAIPCVLLGGIFTPFGVAGEKPGAEIHSPSKVEVHAATKHDLSRPLGELRAEFVSGILAPEIEGDENFPSEGVPAKVSRESEAIQHDAAAKQIPRERLRQHAPGSRLSTSQLKQGAVARQAQLSAAPQSPANSQVSTTPGLNFDGIGDISGWPVSDSNGSVGATQFVEWVNSQFAIFDKSTGTMVFGPAAGNTLWSGFGGPCETRNDGDPIAQYDKAAGRWVMTKHATPPGGPYLACVAVSTTSDATGSYNRYSFPLPSFYPDYPKLGVWSDAYYLSWNLLNQNSSYAFVNPLVCAFDRNSMLSGSAATSVCFQPSSVFTYLLPSDWDGSNPPPAGAPDYFMNLGTNALNVWQFHVDFQTPANSTFTGPTSIPVTPFVQACPGGAGLGLCIPQKGAPQRLDSLHDRLMYRLAYRNFPSGPETIVATHSVGNTISGIRWYEIRNPGGTPYIWQQGTFAPDSNFRWDGSIAMDQMGDIAVGYSISGTNMNPSIRYTGRLASDPLGTMQSEVTILQGSASQTGSSRWGDYSSISIDPMDDCTFWYTNQYILSNNNWQTRIANFQFTGCGTTQPVTLSTPLPFASQRVGTTSAPQNVTLTNNQTFALNLSKITTTGDFAQTNNCGASVLANSSCQISVTFTPTAAGTRNGSVVVTDDAPNSPQTANLTGTGVGPIASLSTTSLSFGYETVAATSSAKPITLTNTGNAALTISTIATSASYGESDNCAGVQLQPANSCVINVTFNPSSAGSFAGILSVNDSAAGSPQLVTVSGIGIRPVSLSPVTMTFGTVNVGQTSATQIATVTNNQSSSLSFNFSASGNFSAVGGGASPCGSTLAGGTSCTIAVSFTPTTNGSISGSLVINHNSLYSPQVVDLLGTGANGSAAPLTFSPTSLFFAKVPVGTSSSRTLTVTNSSGANINISSVLPSGNYSLTPTSPCIGTLAPAGNCKFTVNFNPTNLGTIYGAVTIADNAGIAQQTLDLTGTTVLPLSVSVPSSFGSQTVGTVSSPQTITLTNNQNSTLSLGSIAVSGDYVLTSVGINPCGTSIAALAQCTVGVQFAPTATGTIPGILTVSYTGYSAPQEVSLTGTGQ